MEINYSCLYCEKPLIKDVSTGYETYIPCNHTLCNECERESISLKRCKSCNVDILYHFPNLYLKQLVLLNEKQEKKQQEKQLQLLQQKQQQQNQKQQQQKQQLQQHSIEVSSETCSSNFVVTNKTSSSSISSPQISFSSSPNTSSVGSTTNSDSDETDNNSTSSTSSNTNAPISNTAASSSSSSSSNVNPNEICPKHNKECHTYCMDCKTIICPDCVDFEHKDHKEIQMDRNTINRFLFNRNQPDTPNPYLSPQQQQSSSLDHQLFELVKQIKLSKIWKQQSVTHYSSEFKKIQEEFNQYKQILEERKYYLLKFIENQFKYEQSQLEEQIKSLESQADLTKRCIVDIKSNEKNKLKIIKNLSKINMRIAKLVVNSNNVNNYQYQQESDQINNKLADHLRSLGKINYFFKNNKQLLALSKDKTYQFDIDSNHFLPFSDTFTEGSTNTLTNYHTMKDPLLAYKMMAFKDSSNGNQSNNLLVTVSENQKNSQIEIFRINVKTNQIQTKIVIPLKSFKTNCSAIIIQNENLYLIGGVNSKSKDPIKDIDKYNLITNKYEPGIANLSKPKHSCLTSFDGQRYIYIFGGTYKSLQIGRASIEIERLDITTNKCEIISKFQDPDMNDFQKSPIIGCFYHQNYIYYMNEKFFKRFNLLKMTPELLEFPHFTGNSAIFNSLPVNSSFSSNNISNNSNDIYSISLYNDTESMIIYLLLNDCIFYYPLSPQIKSSDKQPFKWYIKYHSINSTDISTSLSCANLVGSRQSWSSQPLTNSYYVQNLHGLLIYNDTN
ncbi:hypothetical protein DICPUDRAFT_96641 [Dictyostelium purpureum]|uniref:B box-type domain-containing protein n=1 Tax=Dictyostelium purpureum TaxID=5786 RepID=F0ZA61_DICPU|nr:uncharacterized protein DICPUDRAFT_96641 [Dictyostelium purpureum]EGC39143.1 hypothetical protein DICPUDRAFT_96641 [Dictyostelium purpureum]|eukprot:XP_003284289.1 hypothetical protein DICPUDRAFT_96641 [Dictyostelium purpureum]